MKVDWKVAMDHSGNNIPCSIHPSWRLHQDVVAWHAAPRRPCKPAALAARRAWYSKEMVIWGDKNGLQQAFTPCIDITVFCRLKGLSLPLGKLSQKKGSSIPRLFGLELAHIHSLKLTFSNPEDRPGPKKESSVRTIHFQGAKMLVSGRVRVFRKKKTRTPAKPGLEYLPNPKKS